MLIEEKMFREDLFYRLNVIPFQIPPLRERKEDIRFIVYHFIKKYSRLFRKSNIVIDGGVWEYLYDYSWPGNVRELENVIEYIMNMIEDGGIITEKLLPKFITETENDEQDSLCLEVMERKYIAKALELHGIDQAGKQRAAEELGIGIATLYRKIKRYNI